MITILNILVSAALEAFWSIGAAFRKMAGTPLSECGAAEESIGGLIVLAAMVGAMVLQ